MVNPSRPDKIAANYVKETLDGFQNITGDDHAGGGGG
jgi:hypothetical protein